MQRGVTILVYCYKPRILGKKNLRICAGWCNSSGLPLGVDFTYQYLWDSQSINLADGSSSEHSQQLCAKCN